MSHPYSIVKGLGLIVDRGEFRPRGGAKTPNQLKVLLTARKELVPEVQERVVKALDLLTDDDFRGLKAEDVLSYIIEEFAEE
jgi:hypothetical protein